MLASIAKKHARNVIMSARVLVVCDTVFRTRVRIPCGKRGGKASSVGRTSQRQEQEPSSITPPIKYQSDQTTTLIVATGRSNDPGPRNPVSLFDGDVPSGVSTAPSTPVGKKRELLLDGDGSSDGKRGKRRRTASEAIVSSTATSGGKNSRGKRVALKRERGTGSGNDVPSPHVEAAPSTTGGDAAHPDYGLDSLLLLSQLCSERLESATGATDVTRENAPRESAHNTNQSLTPAAPKPVIKQDESYTSEPPFAPPAAWSQAAIRSASPNGRRSASRERQRNSSPSTAPNSSPERFPPHPAIAPIAAYNQSESTAYPQVPPHNVYGLPAGASVVTTSNPQSSVPQHQSQKPTSGAPPNNSVSAAASLLSIANLASSSPPPSNGSHSDGPHSSAVVNGASRHSSTMLPAPRFNLPPSAPFSSFSDRQSPQPPPHYLNNGFTRRAGYEGAGASMEDAIVSITPQDSPARSGGIMKPGMVTSAAYVEHRLHQFEEEQSQQPSPFASPMQRHVPLTMPAVTELVSTQDSVRVAPPIGLRFSGSVQSLLADEDDGEKTEEEPDPAAALLASTSHASRGSLEQYPSNLISPNASPSSVKDENAGKVNGTNDSKVKKRGRPSKSQRTISPPASAPPSNNQSPSGQSAPSGPTNLRNDDTSSLPSEGRAL
ncbi:hypothetical protein HDU97_006964 [Phlyctochytrium planicorne]|nr:hypothetical protein HDU97_006964 [Phlyctochytrium planicorne]